MGEGKVKTAFELAMEKVDAMPKLNTEELKEERKKESIAKGETIAQKHLQNIHRKIDIRNEMSRFEEDQREFGSRAALRCLSQELSLTQSEQNRHILEGMAQLNETIKVDTALERLNQIIDDFRRTLMKAQSDIGKTESDRLKKEGIAGSAVKPNLKTNSAWQEKFAELSATYTGKLYEFQQTLIAE